MCILHPSIHLTTPYPDPPPPVPASAPASLPAIASKSLPSNASWIIEIVLSKLRLRVDGLVLVVPGTAPARRGGRRKPAHALLALRRGERGKRQGRFDARFDRPRSGQGEVARRGRLGEGLLMRVLGEEGFRFFGVKEFRRQAFVFDIFMWL